MVCWDRTQTVPGHSTSVSLTCALSFLSLLSHYKDMTSWVSKYKAWTKTRLNTWQQIRGNWGNLWPNRQGGRWHDRTSSIPTLPRSVHSSNTDESSDDEFIPIPLACWDVSNNSSHQSIGNMTGKAQNVAPQINKDSAPYSVFMFFCGCYCFVGGGDQSILSCDRVTVDGVWIGNWINCTLTVLNYK
jgi:hypothetical protein